MMSAIELTTGFLNKLKNYPGSYKWNYCPDFITDDELVDVELETYLSIVSSLDGSNSRETALIARVSKMLGGCGQNVGHLGVRKGVRMYGRDDRELALLAVGEGMTYADAALLVGRSRETVRRWASPAGAPAARKVPAYLPFERKLELVARYEAGERAADLASEAGVTGPAVSGWARRLREEGRCR